MSEEHDHEPTHDPELAARLNALPRTLEPEHDLWPGIEGRLASSLTGPAREARVIPLWPALALGLAAAAALALWWRPAEPASTPGSGTGEIAERSPAEAETPAPRAVAPAPAPAAPDALLLPGEKDYLAAADLLTRAIDDQRDALPDELARVYEENVGVVDEAISSSRTALAADPDDEQLQALLDDAYRRKLDLLEQVASIPGRT